MTFSYLQLLGRGASWRLQNLVLPRLVWNQIVYGEMLLSVLKAKKEPRWLDAGCGIRVLARGLRKLEDQAIGQAKQVVGTDIDLDALKDQRNLKGRLCCSLDALPFANESFDVITCNMVTEHLTHPDDCLTEIARVLAPEGTVIIHTPNILNYAVFLNHTLGRLLPKSLILQIIRAGEDRTENDVYPTYYRMNSLGKIRKLAYASGLMVDEERTLPPPRPVFNFFLPIAAVELLLTRLLAMPCLQGLQTILLVVMRKSTACTETKLVTQRKAVAVGR